MGETSNRILNFVLEEQLEESKRKRGVRVEDGSAGRDRPLFEILKENKDKRDADFNDRFKHKPPKALDQDESEFLHNLHQSQKDYEQHLADDEARQLIAFQAAQIMIDDQPQPQPQPLLKKTTNTLPSIAISSSNLRNQSWIILPIPNLQLLLLPLLLFHTVMMMTLVDFTATQSQLSHFPLIHILDLHKSPDCLDDSFWSNW